MFVLIELLLSLVTAPVLAQSYPTRPVQIVVAYAPGGGVDLAARLFAAELERKLGQSFVVVNRPGALGTVGAANVAHAKPDGHTLLLGYSSEIAIAPYLVSTAYSAQDFVPVVMAGETPLVLIGKKGLAPGNLADLITLFRSKPDDFTYASTGPGSPANIAGELFKLQAKVALRHVPYKGGGSQAVTDVAGGHADIFFSGMPPAVSFVRGGHVKAYAITGNVRSSALPEVPTMDEAGFPEFGLTAWFALFAPKGTNADVIEKLRATLVDSLKAKGAQDSLTNLGIVPRPLAGAELQQFVDSESGKYRKHIKELGIAIGK
jgi:tripartite-type tricarboxylate transporter receptor subunit TctC